MSTDVRHLIKSFQILNCLQDESTVSIEEFPFQSQINEKSYIISDADEQLLILVEFKKIIDLDSIKIYSLLNDNINNNEIDASPPKLIKVYKLNNVHINFDDMSSMKANKSLNCSLKKLNKGQNINLKKNSQNSIRFKSIRFLAIYIESNQNNTENTFINGITFKGKTDQLKNTQILGNELPKNGLIVTTPDKAAKHKYNLLKSAGFTDIDETYQQSDVVNTKKLNEMVSQLNKAEITAMKSCYLLESHTVNGGNCQHGVENCGSFERVCIVLTNYHQWIKQQQNEKNEDDIFENVDEMDADAIKKWVDKLLNKHKTVIDIFNDYDYDNKMEIKLSNDFNHLLYRHDNEFEKIYNLLTEKSNNKQICLLSNCLLNLRNNRDREIDDDSLYFVDKFDINDNKEANEAVVLPHESRELVIQQMMDRIHCYYFHSFDNGYRLTQKDRENISVHEAENKENKEEDVGTFDLIDYRLRRFIDTKTKNCEYAINTKSKFSMGFSNNKDMQHNTYSTYSYGNRYFYWNYYKNNNNTQDDAHSLGHTQWAQPPDANNEDTLKQWYVNRKYSNFKDEMLNNGIITIGLKQWYSLLQKAQFFIHTDSCKEISICPRLESAECYDMRYDDEINLGHLIAVMVYCNLDTYQRRFTETFRYKNNTETKSQMVERHRNFWFLGKYLREAVECFGTFQSFWGDFTRYDVYHGANKQFTFSTVFAYVKGPFSTSLDYSVALNFCGNTGVILKLQIDRYEWAMSWSAETEANERLNVWDCCWLSDFVNEKEIFCFGGLGKFKFVTIIQAPKGTNYEKYIRALNQMSYCVEVGNTIQNTLDFPRSGEEKQFVFRLLSHRLYAVEPNHKMAIEFKSCSEYITILLNNHCREIKTIYFGNNHPKPTIFDLFFKNDNDWIKLDLVAKMFPNIRNIGYFADCRYNEEETTGKSLEWLQKSFVYGSIFDFIKMNKAPKLKLIQIRIKKEYADMMEIFLYRYKEKFDELQGNWNVFVNVNNVTFPRIHPGANMEMDSRVSIMISK